MILLLSILLVVLVPIDEPWGAIVIIAGCVLEVGEVAVLRRWAKRLDRRTAKTTGAEAMLGKRGEVAERCHPSGMIRVNGELWEAYCAEGAEVGDVVRIDSVDGLTLIVKRVDSAAPVAAS